MLKGSISPACMRACAFRPGKHQHLLQLTQGADAMAGLPAPVVPVFIADIAIESLAKGPGLGRAAGGARDMRRMDEKFPAGEHCGQWGRGACDAGGQANRLT